MLTKMLTCCKYLPYIYNTHAYIFYAYIYIYILISVAILAQAVSLTAVEGLFPVSDDNVRQIPSPQWQR